MVAAYFTIKYYCVVAGFCLSLIIAIGLFIDSRSRRKFYLYSAPNQEISDADFDVANPKFKEYTLISGMEKAIESLSARFEFRLSKL